MLPLAFAAGGAQVRTAVPSVIDFETVTIAVCEALPPAPEQVMPKVVVALSAGVTYLPLVPLLPVQPLVAVHEVVLLEAQVSVDVCPALMVSGLALKETAGAAAVTETVTTCSALPPEPVQVSVKVEFALSAPLEAEPLVALLPLHAPDAVQAVALVEVQVSVALLPLVTVLGLAFRDIAGTGELTETVTDCAALPPAPVQVSVNVEFALSAPLEAEPLVALLPLHAPDAVQAVALVEDQVSVAALPLTIVLGLADSDTAGVGGVTDTVADCAALPPGPMQVSVKVEFAVSAPLGAEPLVVLLPLHAPDAVQAVALVEDQVNVALPPLTIVLGLADSDTVGVGGVTDTVADCAALPPAPVQVSVNVEFALSAPLEAEPLVALLPLHAPDAVQAVALVEDQVSVAALPLTTVLGFADSDTAGVGGVTDTVADCAALPPAPVQVNVKVELALRAPLGAEPLVVLLPLHAPDAVQAVALVEDQVNVALLPLMTVLGFADSVTVGTGCVTDTVADCAALPPVPVQVSVNVELAVSAPLEAEPLVALLPLHAPDAAQEVALVEDQVNVALLPLTTVLGFADSVTVGTGCVTDTVADCEALPPAPVHVSVKVEFAVSAPLEAEPLVALLPLHAPDAVQDDAFAEDHASVAALPLGTVLGLAVSDTVGTGCVTDTVADCAALPPAPVHVNVNVEFAVSAPVEAVPLVASLPLHAPDAVQEVALVEDQVSVALPPDRIALGPTLRLTVGAGVFCGETVTVTDCAALPPAPVQVSVNVEFAVSVPLEAEPLVALPPLHAPDAVQEVALVEDQVSVAALPLTTVLGFADSDTVGAGCVTDTVADCAALPPGPVQVSVKVEFAVSMPLETEPLVALLPLQPPDAVQAVAFAEDQASVAALPLTTVLGFADSDTVGAGCVTDMVADCEALPPGPVQVSVNVEFAVSVPLETEPLVALLPLHAPEAVQAVAFAEDQASVAALPLTTVLGLAVSVRVGCGGFTDTVTDCEALPPAPVHISVYVALAVNAPVETEPPSVWIPFQAPVAAHEVALLEAQVSVAALPLMTVLGFADSDTVGVGGVTDTVTDCAALPPAPTQVNV